MLLINFYAGWMHGFAFEILISVLANGNDGRRKRGKTTQNRIEYIIWHCLWAEAALSLSPNQALFISAKFYLLILNLYGIYLYLAFRFRIHAGRAQYVSGRTNSRSQLQNKSDKQQSKLAIAAENAKQRINTKYVYVCVCAVCHGYSGWDLPFAWHTINVPNISGFFGKWASCWAYSIIVPCNHISRSLVRC